jgi:hypothetical protein
MFKRRTFDDPTEALSAHTVPAGKIAPPQDQHRIEIHNHIPTSAPEEVRGMDQGGPPHWFLEHKEATDAAIGRIGDTEKNDRDCAGLALQRRRDRGRHCEDDLRLQRDQLLRKRLVSTRIRSGKAMLNVDGAALHPTKAGEPLSKFRKLAIPFLVVLGGFLQHADPPHALARLLRARCHRPSRRAAE